jgi:hypothetical protein
MKDAVAGLVSIIVPALDSERWIGAAIESVLAQSYRDWELLVVDNGSTDGTLDVVRRLAPQARLLTATKRGPSAARNAGLDAATGEFIQFLDADDLLDPDKLSRHVHAARETDRDVVWGAYSFIYPAPGDESFVASATAIVPRIDSADVLASLITTAGFIPLGAAFFQRRGAVAQQRFDEDHPVIEDVRYLVHLRAAGATFGAADTHVGLLKREHPSPNRASRVESSVFLQACLDNAQLVLDESARAGAPLTPAQRRAVADVHLHAALGFAVAGDQRFDETLRRLAALDPAYVKRLGAPERVLTPLFGLRRAARVRNVLDRARELGRRTWRASSR